MINLFFAFLPESIMKPKNELFCVGTRTNLFSKDDCINYIIQTHYCSFFHKKGII